MIQGWDKLQKQLKAISDADYTPALEKGVREAILPEMQALTPVDEGDLKASEDVVRENNTVSLVAGSDEAHYALYVEMGTVHQAAQPFMRPAIDTKSDAAMKIAAKEAENIIKKVI
jgi:HK97 gp10 family phage protein